MLDSYFVDTCRKIDFVRNNFGDFLYSGDYTTLKCRFRDILGIQRTNNQQLVNADAMVWFASTAEIEKGDIIYFDSQYYQVERITRAKKLGSTNVEFLKCELKITEVGIS